MLTHVHKVIHLVVGTFEQGLGTSPAECPTVPPAPYTEKTEVTVSDWTLDSVGPERLVSGSRGRAFWSHDRTLGRSATGCWQGAFGQC